MMNVCLHILNASGALGTVATFIEDEFTKSLKKISSALSVSDVDVVVYDNSKGVIPEVGIGGYSPNGHVMFLYLDATSSILKKTIQEQLKKTLAHELHHCMRWRNPGYGKTLLEALVSEGLADHFDLEVNGGNLQPWCTALHGEEVTTFFKRAEREYNVKDYHHREWFFGTGSLPRWVGYTLGYQIVGTYLKKYPDQTAASLVSTPAKAFIVGLRVGKEELAP